MVADSSAMKDVLNVMLQEDTISDAASAATNFPRPQALHQTQREVGE